MRTGVLSLQGAFAEHIRKLRDLGNDVFEIRSQKDIEKPFDALVLPGGESTAMKKLLDATGLLNPLKQLISEGIPVLATCAGLILLAKNIEGGEESCFASMDIEVKRNAYGRQLGSFRCKEHFNGEVIEMPFIRAPYVTKVGKDTEILSVHDDKIVAVKQGRQIAVSFHPELTDDTAVYDMFLKI
ncbi:MAG: pyridoxal 5'-phosphate synthase glutaminase subunit PdxT [Firmicutes bacterium]|nr:pyridoxal 5'-phosphate synthase glutaminase subunit PdxT [Bacillota bacterium]